MPHAASGQPFYDQLVANKLIVPVGVPGAFGRGAVFESVLRRFDGAVSRLTRRRLRTHFSVARFNYHREHFGKIFDIHTSDGELAQTACLGFGLERVVMALFKAHGFVPAEWPTRVREVLGS
jgi:hypothetical protein